jgi:hypothetical protein
MIYRKLNPFKLILVMVVLALFNIGCSTSSGSKVSQVTVEPISQQEANQAQPAHQLASYCKTLASSRVQSTRGPSVAATPETTESRLDALFFGDPVRWKTIRDEDGIKTFQDLEATDQVIGFRGQTVIHAPLKKIATILNQQDLRPKWVDDLAEDRVIREQSKFDRLEYTHAKAPWPFQDRDFVFRATVSVLQEPNATMIRMVSVNDPMVPPRDNIVRGKIKRAYYFLREMKDGNTELVVEMAVDPAGIIPKWLANLTQRQWPQKTLVALRKLAESPDLAISPDMERYFSAR